MLKNLSLQVVGALFLIAALLLVLAKRQSPRSAGCSIEDSILSKLTNTASSRSSVQQVTKSSNKRKGTLDLLIDERRSLEESGFGPRHPQMISLALQIKAREHLPYGGGLSEDEGTTLGELLEAEQLDLSRAHQELRSKGLGPNHPTLLALNQTLLTLQERRTWHSRGTGSKSSHYSRH